MHPRSSIVESFTTMNLVMLIPPSSWGSRARLVQVLVLGGVSFVTTVVCSFRIYYSSMYFFTHSIPTLTA